MRKTTIYLAVGLSLVCALAATFMIVTYLKNRPAPETAEMMPVVVAVRDLTFGNVLAPEHMRVVAYPKASLPKGFYSTPDSLIGQVNKVFIMENEPIIASKLSSTGGGLSLLIADNMRAASVQVDKVSGVSGFVLPGDRVDVIASIQRREGARDEAIATTVLQNIEVLAAGEKTQQQGDKVIAVQSVTLLVDAVGAQTLALVSREAKLHLALRNPGDTDTTTIASVTKSEIMDGKKKPAPKVVYVKTPEKKPVADTTKPKPVDNTVTVFKGSTAKTQTPPLTSGNGDTASTSKTSPNR